MCRKFDATRSYRKDLDVRQQTWADWCDRFDHDKPNGALWTLVGCRRAGKSWALAGIREALGRPKSVLVDLRELEIVGDLTKRARGKPCLLLDEPKRLLEEPEAFIDTCAALKSANRRIVLACTPGEWETLKSADRQGNQVQNRDRSFLTPLSRLGWTALSGPGWPGRLAEAVPIDWKQTPFLLELLLWVAAQNPHFTAGGPFDDDRLAALLKQAAAEAETHQFNYIANVFKDGLSPSQRTVLRKVIRGEALSSAEEEPRSLLESCNLIACRQHAYRISDPVLTTHLRPPLIIHHISDIHMGPKEASAVDAKDSSRRGAVLAAAAAPATVREAYTEYLNTTQAPPHLLVASGDFAQTGSPAEMKTARAWLDRQKRLLHPHPDMNGTPTLLVVGGNHDVDWENTAGTDGARRRHRAFADCFEGVPRPKLEDAPETRGLTVECYPEIGLRFILLGSSELGGEIGNDEAFDNLLALAMKLSKSAKAALGEDDTKRFEQLQEHLNRIDPGLVHHKDIYRLQKINGDGYLNILVLHHPVTAMPAAPEIARTAGLINAGAVKNACFSSGIDLVLHGHQHTGWYAEETWPERFPDHKLRILAAPTLGSFETMEPCGFNELRVYREGTDIEVELRRVIHNGAGWDTNAPLIASINK